MAKEYLEKTEVDIGAITKLFAERGEPLTEQDLEYLRTEYGEKAVPPDPDEADDADDEVEEVEDSEPEEELIDEPDEDVEEELIEEEESDAPTKGAKLTKEQKKIVSQKRELKDMTDYTKSLEEELEKYRAQTRKDELRTQYAEDNDDATAERLASTDYRFEELETRVKVAEFRAENATLLKRYPSANGNEKWIMDAMHMLGVSAEVVCASKFGKPEPADVKRAKAANRGELETKSDDFSVASTTRAGESRTTSGLTSEQKKFRRTLTSAFGEMTDAEFASAWAAKQNNERT